MTFSFIRIKGSTLSEHLQERMSKKPEIFEFHLEQKDLYENRSRLIQQIRDVQSMGVQVYLHQPMTYDGYFVNIIDDDEKKEQIYDETTKRLVEVCQETHTQSVIHAHYQALRLKSYHRETVIERMKERIENVLTYGKESLLWENTISKPFCSAEEWWFEKIIQPLNLNICYDISHSFISFKGDNEKLLTHLKQCLPYIRYLHVVDSMGEVHDGLELGKGKIQWKPIQSLINDLPFIFEIDLKESAYADSAPMVNSGLYWRKLSNKKDSR